MSLVSFSALPFYAQCAPSVLTPGSLQFLGNMALPPLTIKILLQNPTFKLLRGEEAAHSALVFFYIPAMSNSSVKDDKQD